MNLPYINNDASEMIETIIDPIMIMERFAEAGMVDADESDSYSNKCVDMCNLVTYAIGQQLTPFSSPDSIIVKEGVFGMIGNHTWIEIEDIIVDATLQQFVPNAKELCLLDNNCDLYHSVRSYTYDEWLETSPNVGV